MVSLVTAASALAADGGMEGGALSSLIGPASPRLLVAPLAVDGGVGLGRGSAPGQAPSGGPVVVTGALDKSLIQRVIRAHLGLIRECAADHPSSGEQTVMVQFIIDGSGAVTSSKPTQTTPATEPLARCTAGVFERMVFPKPLGGGVVTVNYPFRFAAPSLER
jgi:hypothetical protein